MSVMSSVVQGATGFTTAGLQANANRRAAEANQSWQTIMSNSAYQRAVIDMERAGLNPAMMYNAPGGSQASTPIRMAG